jgi:dTDP-glucose pyrophosphorylase/CBS domain-containing protein
MMARPFFPNLGQCLVVSTDAIGDVVRRIDKSRIGIALLIDDERRLTATITDGDVRRAMLAGVSFDEPAWRLLDFKSASAHPVPITRPVTTADDELLHIMRAADVQHIPLLDEHGCVADLALLRALVPDTADDIRAVVMAGGFGTRLRPFTDDTPKPMLPVGDKPLLERTIENLREAGITEVNISTHYLHKKIVDHFGSGAQFGVNLRYLQEERPLGTAGALGLLGRPTQTTLVINGDVLTTVDFRAMTEFHRSHTATLTVAVRLYEMAVPYGVIDCDDVRVTAVREKPSLRFFVNAGIYLIEPSAWDFISNGVRVDMTQMIERLIAGGGKVVSFPIREYWLDVGQPDDYERAQRDMAAGRLER